MLTFNQLIRFYCNNKRLPYLVLVVVFVTFACLTLDIRGRQNVPPKGVIKSESTPKIQWKIMTTVSNGFQDMFNNWLFHYLRLGLSMEIILVAEDRHTYKQYAKNKYVKVIQGDFVLDTKNSLDYNTQEYNVLVSKRAKYLLREIDLGNNIIYSDVDTVWLKDIRTYFKGNYDIWGAFDGPLEYCTGILAFKSTEAVKNMLRQWDEALQKPQVNQAVFNSVIWNSSVHHVNLPLEQFPNGYMYFVKKQRKNVAVVHNNYIIGHKNKIRRFKDIGLWNVTN